MLYTSDDFLMTERNPCLDDDYYAYTLDEDIYWDDYGEWIKLNEDFPFMYEEK